MRVVIQIFLIALLGTGLASAAPPASNTVTREELVGVWSFDGTCASGFGMALHADGRAGYDEWGEGLWALTDKGQRLVLIVRDIREDADRFKEAQLLEFKMSVKGANKITFASVQDGVQFPAMKCP